MAIKEFRSREIAQRIIASGELVLTAPAHFGGGLDDARDMSLALDALEEKPAIWGTSLAGALRTFARTRLLGFAQVDDEDYKKSAEDPAHIINQVFGNADDEQGNASWLVVNDALAEQHAIEYRDMVDIDPATRTAVDQHKFDAELIAAGTRFPLRLELLIPQSEIEADGGERFKQVFALILQGLQNGDVALGAKKSRGWGACEVKNWTLTAYDLTQKKGLLGWLSEEKDEFILKGTTPQEMLQVDIRAMDARDVCRITVVLNLAGPMMIAAVSDDPNEPDASQLSGRNAQGETEWKVSGTGAAGALRNQCYRILRTIGYTPEAAKAFQDRLWGYVEESEEAAASRLRVGEAALRNVFARVQTRIRINHFTGGTYPGALFNETIVMPEKEDNLTLAMEVRNPRKAEIGLLMLALKDLCTRELTIGGGYGIGRGYMEGRKITIAWEGQGLDLEITQGEDNQLTFSDDQAAATLEKFVKLLHAKKEEQHA
jgi:CRISPR/Cas system CSM-associated protein Csm3 (group 7 of RAMP superfamily)